jgi:hypothetical protein
VLLGKINDSEYCHDPTVNFIRPLATLAGTVVFDLFLELKTSLRIDFTLETVNCMCRIDLIQVNLTCCDDLYSRDRCMFSSVCIA